MPEPRIKVAVAIVLYRSGRGATYVLVGQRPPDVHLPGLWEFPGGKLEPGETASDCAIREVREETGVHATLDGHFHSEKHDYADRSVEIEFFLCRYESGIPQPVQCQAVRWVEAGGIEAYRFPEANRDLLARVRELGESSSPHRRPDASDNATNP